MDNQTIDFTTHYLEDFSKLKEKVHENEKRIEDLSLIKETLVKLGTIQEQMIKDNAIRDVERRENSKAMLELSNSVKMTSDNVAKLSKKLDDTNEKMDSNEKKLDQVVLDRTEIIEDRKNRFVFWGAIITSLITSGAAILLSFLKNI